jgi:hypothetical protein
MEKRLIFIQKRTTCWDFLYAILFSVVTGSGLGLVYLYRIGELPCLN